ncbi:hypothetical protein [Endozoicomonas ascidiicola]|uniref:hypothetical protein n=1 Tax=Endozoicomonas ascidiicola TaxID=1698521 RepID=UPI00083512C3|nr:hypothetical protein [Endozoicomonas ascidiicola]
MIWLRFTGCFLLFLSFSSATYSAHYHDDVEAFPPWQKGRGLGELSLEVSTENESARQHFLTGLKLLHAYEFSEATWSLRAAQKLDPGFAMAYWGEIIASRMLVWYSRNDEQGQSALKRLEENADLSRLTDLEKGLIGAAKVLVSKDETLKPFEKGSSAWQFRNKMEGLYQRFPLNHEVKVLYGYSLLGTRRGVRDYKTNLKAITQFDEVLDENPEHPGALHLMLHAAENPVQAYLARHAAETINEMVSAAIHTLHMPSHYYIALGDWQEVVDINRMAWSASIRRAYESGLGSDTFEYHGQGWVIYGLLQQGNYQEALAEMNKLYREFDKKPSSTIRRYLLFARAGFLVDAPVGSKESKLVLKQRVDHQRMISAATGADLLAEAYLGWQMENNGMIAKANRRYHQLMDNDLQHLSPPEQDAAKIMGLLTRALEDLQNGRSDASELKLSRAANLEVTMVHEHGIPLIVKPANELYAEFLLKEKRFGEALHYYKKALAYYPKRMSSLKGQAVALSELYDAYN